jgi:capsular exopolysaccharide synthesis family protein
MGKVIQLSLAGDRRRSGDIESFRIIRRNIEQMLARVSSGTILVTSPLPEEGKSTVSASLALTAVAAGRRTLLLEADLRRPTLGKRLGLATKPGLAEYLSGEAEPAEILQALSVAVPGEAGSENSDTRVGHRLTVITAGSPMVTAAELLTSQRMRDLLVEVAEVYDMVVIDSAPLLPVADTLELLPHVRAVALCVRSSRTTRHQANAARALLEDQPEMDVGLIVTGLRPSDEPGDYGLYAYHFNSSERIKA